MISRQEVLHIAKLARLQLTDEEAERYQRDLSEVLDYFEVLKEADTEDTEPMTHAQLLENVARQDVPSRERPEVILRMAQLFPAVKDGFLKVKSILSRK